MSDFFAALWHQPLLQHAVLVGVLASVASGLVGSYIVVRRITYIAGGIAHSVLGGIGAAVYLRAAHGVEWVTPLYGALAAALGAAMIIGLVSLYWKGREDTAIGAVWAVGMAAGVLFMSATPGYAADLTTYLFGDILLPQTADLWLLVTLDVVIAGLVLVFYHPFLAVCFDEEFARVRGLPTRFYYLLLLALAALTVVLLVRVVGVILVIALLTLPVAVAGRFARSLWQMMLLAALLSAAFTTGGIAASYSWEIPPGATIAVLAGAAYLLVMLAAGLVHRLRRRRRRAPPATGEANP